jgi:predicted nucleotidyltransferase
MSSVTEKLALAGLCNPPGYVRSNTVYETVVGSVAYGVSDDLSDYDVNGFYIPPKNMLFPHLEGRILGFGKDPKPPKAYQQHHIKTERHEYDLNIYGIASYFHLCLENNPNMLDTLYTPRECILHSTNISEMVRERRNLFPHKKCWPKYKGYAYQQLHKMRGKNPEPGSKRALLRERYGFDVKFAYHTVRLLLEAEMIMDEHTIDIRRHREHLKAIRCGEVSQDDIFKWAAEKEAHLERAFEKSTLRAEPDREGIKQLLLDCLEHHYGDLDVLTVVRNESQAERVALREIRDLCTKVLK